MKPVRKAILPLGTRFLPATKATPKEMLPVVASSLIQYAVDEAREAGIEQGIFVISGGKGVIEDHFDYALELEATMPRCVKSVDLLDGAVEAPGDTVFLPHALHEYLEAN